MPLDMDATFRPLNIALVTVSSTRTQANDTSGDLLADRIEAAGHNLAARRIVTDTLAALREVFDDWIAAPEIDVIISTGGTGLTGDDVTPEALDVIKDKDIPGFGEMFRWISFKSIGPSTIQSRACAVLAGGTYIFALPGSNGAVKDGWDEILVHQLDSRFKPCNFANLIPRLSKH